MDSRRDVVDGVVVDGCLDRRDGCLDRRDGCLDGDVDVGRHRYVCWLSLMLWLGGGRHSVENGEKHFNFFKGWVVFEFTLKNKLVLKDM